MLDRRRHDAPTAVARAAATMALALALAAAMLLVHAPRAHAVAVVDCGRQCFDPGTLDLTVTATAGTREALVDATAHVGELVTYDITLDNPNGHTMWSPRLDDSACSTHDADGNVVSSTIDGPYGDDNGDQDLQADETWHWYCIHVVTDADGTLATEHAHVHASGEGEVGVVADAGSTVSVLRPAARLTLLARRGTTGGFLAAPIAVHAGDVVTLEAIVENTGNAALAPTLALAPCDGDPVHVATSFGTPGSGTAQTDKVLAGGSWTWQCTHIVLSGDPDSFAASASFTGVDALGDTTLVQAQGAGDPGGDTPRAGVAATKVNPGTVHATDSIAVSVLRPRLTLSESVAAPGGTYGPSADVASGATVQVRIIVANPGNVDLLVNVDEPLCTGGLTSSDPAGSDGKVDPIAAGASVTYTCTFVLATTAAAPTQTVTVAGSATATGTDRLGGVVSANGTAFASAAAGGPVVAGASRAPAGTASLSRIAGCQRSSLTVAVSGTQVAAVEYRIDGRHVATLRHATRGRWALRIDARRLGIGSHRLVAIVTFSRASATARRSFGRNLVVCGAAVTTPPFTG